MDREKIKLVSNTKEVELAKLTKDVVLKKSKIFKVIACQVTMDKISTQYVLAKVIIQPIGSGKKTERIIYYPLPRGTSFLLEQVYRISQLREFRETVTQKILISFCKKFPKYFSLDNGRILLFKKPENQ